MTGLDGRLVLNLEKLRQKSSREHYHTMELYACHYFDFKAGEERHGYLAFAPRTKVGCIAKTAIKAINMASTRSMEALKEAYALKKEKSDG